MSRKTTIRCDGCGGVLGVEGFCIGEPGDDDADEKEVVLGYLVTRFYEMGGMTAGISKKIGWEKPE